jgi:hypothetical protein
MSLSCPSEGWNRTAGGDIAQWWPRGVGVISLARGFVLKLERHLVSGSRDGGSGHSKPSASKRRQQVKASSIFKERHCTGAAGHLHFVRSRESAPDGGAFPISRPEPQAATLVASTFRTLAELAIGIVRGFMASGSSRTHGQ